MFSFLLFSLGLADTHIYILVNALDLRKHFATTLVIVGNSNFLHPKASDSKTISCASAYSWNIISLTKMRNAYILPCLFVVLHMLTITQALPTINHVSNNSRHYDSNEDESKTSRNLKYFIDGTIHHIKLAGVTYQQRLIDGQCAVEYGGQYLTEKSVIQIRKKLYRVENCLLERVFHACGPNLLLMLNVVCRVVEKSQAMTTTTPLTVVRRDTTPAIPSILYRLYPRASKTPRVITESCCESLCTISELSRYCHR